MLSEAVHEVAMANGCAAFPRRLQPVLSSKVDISLGYSGRIYLDRKGDLCCCRSIQLNGGDEVGDHGRS